MSETAEDVAVRVLCERDPRWSKMLPSQRETWLRNSRSGSGFTMTLAGVRAGLEMAADYMLSRKVTASEFYAREIRGLAGTNGKREAR